MSEIIIVGGGAAGFFAAITCAEANPNAKITILERGAEVLEKVRISGGGRCNVTHGIFEPKQLVKHYPRGSKELLGPFHKFASGDTMGWFEKRGVELKIEEDGRVFPVSDSSESIIKCFMTAVEANRIKVITACRTDDVRPTPDGKWEVTANGRLFIADKVMLATGSNPRAWKNLEALGHTIVPPVSSLFTFNIKDSRLEGLSGIAMPQVEVSIVGTKHKSMDNFLITHWGVSGFATLKLSAWAARELAEADYKFDISINFRPHFKTAETIEHLNDLKLDFAKRQVFVHPQFGIPARLWQRLAAAAQIPETLRWADLSKRQAQLFAEQLTAMQLAVNGKSTFKEEFVTAGGVELSEINFHTFESRLLPNLFMAGEVLNIDALTGGFNFQAAWTGGYLAGLAMAKEDEAG